MPCSLQLRRVGSSLSLSTMEICFFCEVELVFETVAPPHRQAIASGPQAVT